MTHPTEVKLPESLEAIRAALAAGPTKGHWQVGGSFNEWAISSDYTVHGNPCASGRQFVACCFRVSKKDTPAYAQLFEATARFIAACNPEAITALLDALKARDAEIERLRGDAVRYQWLCANYGETKLPCMLEPAIGDYIADGKASLDAAIDQARAEGGEKTK